MNASSSGSRVNLAAGLAIYILASRLALRHLGGQAREMAMALLNVGGVFCFLFYGHSNNYATRFIVYLVTILFYYAVFYLFGEGKGRGTWIAFFAPLLGLIFFRYVPGPVFVALGHALGKHWYAAPNMIGISYLAFRLSRLVLEVRNGSAKKPGFWEYLSFAFFLPTMSVGPINTYTNFRRGFATPSWGVPAGRATLRILIGLIKYLYLGAILFRLTYLGFLLNGHPHDWVDLPVAMAMYYLFLYCNFSGFCDMAIGVAALIGIPVLENFDNPLAARNLKDFWNRWHITLSQWMRDIVFAPLSKFLVRVMGAPMANHAIAIAVAVVFLLVGIWHGAGWNFFFFGLIHALGLVTNHYYTIGLKKWLGREGFKAYMENRWIQGAATVITFGYCAASLMFFANTLPQIGEIIRDLR